VGTLTALIIVAEIGDITRFPSARKLAAWAGLTPTVRGSDLTVRHGHISKQVSDWLRWILCEAAQTAKRSPEFSVTYRPSPAAAARRSPPPPSPAACWHVPTTYCVPSRTGKTGRGADDSSRQPPQAVEDPG
jgi:hypothetical protein